MTDKYKNKYRIPSARLQTWDYRWNAAYFVTICTADRQHFFGEIVNGKMVLSHTGVIANILWYEIKNHTKNIELGEFVVMPNHVHGIIILNNENNNNVQTLHATSLKQQTVQTLRATSLQSTENDTSKNEFMSSISPKSNSISTIIRSYKSAITKHARRLGFDFAWQTRFYDHIIRNEKSFKTISEYIINNPAKWQDDKFFNK